NAASGAYTLPFVMQNDQVFMNNALIQDGSITNAKIGNVIQSNNFQENVAGWRLDKNGVFVNYGSTSGEGSIKQTNQNITVRDGSGRVRCQLGRITGAW
ncbi:phage tail tip fiber protein, partial [Enterobacter asburiae]